MRKLGESDRCALVRVEIIGRVRSPCGVASHSKPQAMVCVTPPCHTVVRIQI